MNNQNENNNSGLPEETGEERRARINRVVYITAVILLVSIAIIAGIVSAANKAKKDPVEAPPATSERENSQSKIPESSKTPASSESGTESGSVSGEPDESVSSKLPDFMLPVSGTLSVKHDPELQVFSPTMNDYRVHLGVDINTLEGASVVAAADGVVQKVWDDPLMGKCVAIAHDGDSSTFYKNLSETLAEGIEKGVTVTAGQLIGTVGDSAMMEVAQEPHLHFEMTVGGLQVDPSVYFSDDVWAELEGDTAYEG